jgi:hypothetical protein
MVSLEDTYRRHPDIVTRKIIGETLLVPVRGKTADLHRIYTLTPVAERIWDDLDGTRTLKDIAGNIPLQFEVGSAQASADCLEFVSSLLEEGLVTEV